MKSKKSNDVLRHSFHLPVEQSILVPSTSNKSHRISGHAFRHRIDTVEKYLSKTFGGYTAVHGSGGYVAKKGRLIREPVVEVTSFAKTKEYKAHKNQLFKKIKAWGHKWGQESIGYEHEGDLYYINTERKNRRR